MYNRFLEVQERTSNADTIVKLAQAGVSVDQS